MDHELIWGLWVTCTNSSCSVQDSIFSGKLRNQIVLGK